ncbi:HIRAN domain-containing protein [Sphingomonas sp. RRHST34]|uniref:HIRAN domain-containing protein n=1 Tax=Sphingomonas citri TaxID=2862499 RepID=A0ABS7BQM6_9SPHN|nr:HIRAN domain-containing protein [Sphingomonas citri]MBW6531902.1 HIRAN domain-containing protein [Sphingomonas citri]
MRALSLAVVGADHPNKRGPGRRFELALCSPAEPIELRPEPKNPVDPQAVAVFSCRGVQLGYLTAERAPWIGAMLRSGREIAVAFQEQTQWGAIVRVAFDGAAPTLPPPRVKEQDDSSGENDGFWPDPVYDD